LRARCPAILCGASENAFSPTLAKLSEQGFIFAALQKSPENPQAGTNYFMRCFKELPEADPAHFSYSVKTFGGDEALLGHVSLASRLF
jgi:hypothetical protein